MEIFEDTSATDTPAQARFRRLVRTALQSGIKPTPSKILEWQGSHGYVRPGGNIGGPSISGHYSNIRIQELQRAGWTREDFGTQWLPPARVRA